MRRELWFTTDLTGSALRLFEDVMWESVRARGRFGVGLSGGSTPGALYRALATRPSLPWDATHVFWGDERFVPHDHPDSNYRAAREALLAHVPIPAQNVHPWPAPAADTDLGAAAARYAETIQSVLGESPLFDLQLLGLGEDGHTASLFPGTGSVLEPVLTVGSQPPGVAQPRLSLSAFALSHSRTVVFLVSGEAKRPALRDTLAGEGDFERYPARAVEAVERLVWLTDLAGSLVTASGMVV